MRGRSWLFAAGVLGLLVGLAVIIRGSWKAIPPVSPTSGHAPSEVKAGAPVEPPMAPNASESRQPVSPVPKEGASDARPGGPFRTVEEVGRDFWGTRWEEIKPKLAERIPLDTKMDIVLPPWKDVQPLVCAELKLSDSDIQRQAARFLPPDPITLVYLMNGYDLDPKGWGDGDIYALEVSLLEVRADGQEALADYRRLLDRALAARCGAGQYDYSPIANIEAPHTPKDALYVTSCSISGWVITCAVGQTDLPELAEVEKRLRAIKSRCATIIAKAIADKKR